MLYEFGGLPATRARLPSFGSAGKLGDLPSGERFPARQRPLHCFVQHEHVSMPIQRWIMRVEISILKVPETPETINHDLDDAEVFGFLIAMLRQILTLAAGALALLAGLGPDIPSDGPSKYLLATTWAGLGLGIVFGAAATYIDADRAMRSAVLFSKHLLRVIEQESSSPLIPVPPNRLYALCKPLMVISLLIAVVCLTAFAITTTLAV